MRSLESEPRLAHWGFAMVAIVIAAVGWLLYSESVQSRDATTSGRLLGLAFATFGSLVILLPAYMILTRQNRARRRAEAERERFFTISLDMLCIAGADGYFKRLNPAFTETLGWSLDELMARPFIEFIHPDDRESTLREVERQVRSGDSVLSFENRYRHKDGSWRVLSWKSVPVRGELMMATARDVTEQRRISAELISARDAAQAANSAKSSFLATMSHEIRTPMNGVLGVIDLLGLTRLDNEQRTMLDIVRSSGHSLLRIINDVLDLSKMEAGKLEIRPEPASVAQILEDVSNLYSGYASSKGLILRRSIDPHISPAIQVDPLRLRQVLNNFVSNAVKFTFQGSVEISAELLERVGDAERLRFSVRDTGIGISPEAMGRLFQPYTQADRTTTQRFGGSGLGLTISRRLADAMGGAIDMTSTSGGGTTMVFSLTVPIADPKDLAHRTTEHTQESLSAAVTARRQAPSIHDAQAEGTLLLIAEDHPTNRAILQRQVNMLGYAAETAEDGADALRMWTSGRFGMVIADCSMPGLDGYELARSIREHEADGNRKGVPIIACTANALGGDAERCLAAGMNDYLSKPVQLADLLRKLDQWLPLPVPGTTEPRLEEASSPVDMSVLAALRGSDGADDDEILREFRRTTNIDVVDLIRAADKRELDKIARTAHRIKSGSRTIGANELAKVCEEIEGAVRAGDLKTVQGKLPALAREVARLNAYFGSRP